MFIEVCVDNIDSAITAKNSGADRIELCSHLAAGGLTPSYGLLLQCREKIKIPVHVMIRPRAGNFLYSTEDFEVMKSDVKIVKQMGFEGIVFGVLTIENNPDILRIKEIVKLARPMKVTFHRAFDVCSDPFNALDDLIFCQINTVLTSGQKNTAWEGIDLLTRLILKAGNAIEILVGSGITDENIKQISAKTGAKYFHLSAKIKGQTLPDNKINAIQFGSTDENNYLVNLTDESMIRKIKSFPI